MAYTTAQRKKFFELVKKYENASVYNEEAKDLSNRIKAMSKTPQGLNELAKLVTEDIEEEMKAYDIRNLFFGGVKQRELNEVVEYKKKGKFRAYHITRGGYVPKSRIFQDTVTVVPEEFAVRPATDLVALETGRISAVQELRDGAKEALLTLYARYTFGMLDTIVGNDPAEDNYSSVTGEVDKTTLDKMIAHFSRWGKVNVYGTHNSLMPIMDFAGYSDQTLRDIEMTGNLGIYRGANLIKLEEFTDADDAEVIQDNKIFIVPTTIGHIDDFGPMRERELIDPEHDEFSIIMRKHWGFTVMHDNKIGMIELV